MNRASVRAIPPQTGRRQSSHAVAPSASAPRVGMASSTMAGWTTLASTASQATSCQTPTEGMLVVVTMARMVPASAARTRRGRDFAGAPRDQQRQHQPRDEYPGVWHRPAHREHGGRRRGADESRRSCVAPSVDDDDRQARHRRLHARATGSARARSCTSRTSRARAPPTKADASRSALETASAKPNRRPAGGSTVIAIATRIRSRASETRSIAFQ